MTGSGIVRASGNSGSSSLRAGLVLLILLASVAGCVRRPAAGVEQQTEDYSAARKHFQTHLVKHGPSPQAGEALRPPAGAQQVEYSPSLHLLAWLTPAPSNAGASGMKSPAVLFLHGGFAIGGDDWEMTRPYREAGYTVMMPALRGENGLPGEYSMFYDEVSDVLAASDYLANVPYVDAKRIYVAGHSVGGTLTLLAAMASTRFKAATSFSGAPDAKAFSQGPTDRVAFDTSNPKEFEMRSPVSYAGSFKCPVRIYCGTEEAIFVEASQLTSDLAKKQGLDVEAVLVPGDHFSAVPEEIKRSIRFFQLH